MRNSRAITILFITAVIFSLYGVFANVLNQKLSFSVLLFYLQLIALIFFVVSLAVKKINPLAGLKHNFVKLVIFAIVSNLPILFFNLANKFEKVGTVLTVQNSLTIIFALLASVLFLRERLNFHIKALSSLIIILGLILIIKPAEPSNLLGIFFASLVGITNGLTNLLRRLFFKKINPYTLGLHKSILGVLVYSVINILQNEPLIPQLNSGSLLILILYGTLNGITFLMLLYAFGRVPFTLGNLILTLEVILGMLTGFIFLGQIINLEQILASVIIIAAIYIIKLLEYQEVSLIKATNGNIRV